MSFVLPYKFSNYWNEIKLIFKYTIAMLFITSIACYLYIEPILYTLSKHLLLNIKSNKFFFSEITQIFINYIEFSIKISLLIVIPFICFNIYSYFITSLYYVEAKKITICLGIFIFWYFIIIHIILKILLPNFLNFFLIYENSSQYFPLYYEAKFESYFYLVFQFLYTFLIFFQIPIFFLFCYIFKVFDLKFLYKIKSKIFIIFVIISTIVAPPDILLQILIISFFIFFFEFFIYNIYFFKKLQLYLKKL